MGVHSDGVFLELWRHSQHPASCGISYLSEFLAQSSCHVIPRVHPLWLGAPAIPASLLCGHRAQAACLLRPTAISILATEACPGLCTGQPCCLGCPLSPTTLLYSLQSPTQVIYFDSPPTPHCPSSHIATLTAFWRALWAHGSGAQPPDLQAGKQNPGSLHLHWTWHLLATSKHLNSV